MVEKLRAYNQKRDFTRTLEPEGRIETSQDRLSFVIQHHLARRNHYDLRLEWGGVLLSWAVPKGPSYDTRDKRLAIKVEDHPLAYRNFEGTIPKGEYGGGVVMLWDEGYWEPNGDVNEGLQKGMLKFALHGRRLKGKWALVRLKKDERESKDNWLLLKEKDEYAKTGDGITVFTTSIRTGRTMAEIEAGKEAGNIRNPFESTGVQLAKLVQRVPKGEDWLFELKYDGYRILAYVQGSKVRLLTRNGHDYTEQFREVASSLVEWAGGRAMVLDGEMVVTDQEGKTDFQALQNYLKNPGDKNLTYIIFDLLALDGMDLRGQPLIDRKKTLETLLQNAPKNLYYSRHVIGEGTASLAAACEAGLEGIIGKKADSVYSGTRNGDWVKLKCDQRQEFVIGGYTLSDKRKRGVSSLLLGVYEGGELIYVGRAGTGFSEADRKELEEKFKAIRKEKSPFKLPPKASSKEKIIWLEPELVAEIKFAQWTKDRLLRQASFKGLRTDKDPRDIKMEKADEQVLPSSSDQKEKKMMSRESKNIIIEGIKISNPDKLIFADLEITKGDVVQYYAQVAGRMLPYVSRRILSIVRCPKGISQTCFYKKHPGPGGKGVITIPVVGSDGESDDYFYIEDITGLIYEAQMGTLEFHIWGSSVDQLEKPDMMVFDLDPDEGMDLSKVRQGVRDVKNMLDELSLKSYLKTSGGKGYHVVVPFKPVATWDEFYDFAKRFAEVMEQRWPDRYTSNVRKLKRTGKIFIDWIRNGRGATSIAPYSLRARKGAKVSMPIGWDELDRVAPDGVDMAEALRRINGSDPWHDFFQNQQQLR